MKARQIDMRTIKEHLPNPNERYKNEQDIIHFLQILQ